MVIRLKNLSSQIRKVSFFIIIVVALSFRINYAWANNLTVSNFKVYGTNTVSKSITFTCDVSWDNSWRNSTNHDAIWLFLKYSTNGGASWSHATMSLSGTNPTGFNPPSNFEIVVNMSLPKKEEL